MSNYSIQSSVESEEDRSHEVNSPWYVPVQPKAESFEAEELEVVTPLRSIENNGRQDLLRIRPMAELMGEPSPPSRSLSDSEAAMMGSLLGGDILQPPPLRMARYGQGGKVVRLKGAQGPAPNPNDSNVENQENSVGQKPKRKKKPMTSSQRARYNARRREQARRKREEKEFLEYQALMQCMAVIQDSNSGQGPADMTLLDPNLMEQVAGKTVGAPVVPLPNDSPQDENGPPVVALVPIDSAKVEPGAALKVKFTALQRQIDGSIQLWEDIGQELNGICREVSAKKRVVSQKVVVIPGLVGTGIRLELLSRANKGRALLRAALAQTAAQLQGLKRSIGQISQEADEEIKDLSRLSVLVQSPRAPRQ